MTVLSQGRKFIPLSVVISNLSLRLIIHDIEISCTHGKYVDISSLAIIDEDIKCDKIDLYGAIKSSPL